MNKFYIQIALFILSTFAYGNNETLATDPTPGTAAKPSRFTTSEEIYEKNKHLICKSPTEPIIAAEVMNEAVKHLEYYATTKGGYEQYLQNSNDSISYYIKKFDNETNILKVHLNIYDSSQYNYIINRTWDPNSPNIFNKGAAKIIYMYNPNLMLIRQFCKKYSKDYQKYFYALVSKTEISKDKTIIAITSVNVNDKNPSNIEYNNPILENVNSFRISVRRKDYIKNKKYIKIFVNLAGYLIEKKGDDLEITYIESIQGYSSF
ncbi:fam-a protein [Plasmodium vinckei vinckei]|uniref:Fam-a protein n=1 Tax=Plasmodium vinckei vinckei TaxID=54757 RepID=A0A449BN99_PLAVN|nr:fam-a protein [Plasmodium vinckei vinckei]VEV54914.1 fam-a protein [Plasmodium vinckei vinckei]